MANHYNFFNTTEIRGIQIQQLIKYSANIKLVKYNIVVNCTYMQFLPNTTANKCDSGIPDIHIFGSLTFAQETLAGIVVLPELDKCPDAFCKTKWSVVK